MLNDTVLHEIATMVLWIAFIGFLNCCLPLLPTFILEPTLLSKLEKKVKISCFVLPNHLNYFGILKQNIICCVITRMMDVLISLNLYE